MLLEDVFPLPLVDDILFLANATLPAMVLVFNGVGLVGQDKDWIW